MEAPQVFPILDMSWMANFPSLCGHFGGVAVVAGGALEFISNVAGAAVASATSVVAATSSGGRLSQVH